MQAGDGLHAAAVAPGQALPVDGLGAADEGAAVLADGNVTVRRQRTGHAGAPEPLAVDVGQGFLVNAGEFGQAGVDAVVDAGDEFDLGLTEIGGDVRVREGGAQRTGMRPHGQLAIGSGPQAFLLQATGDATQGCGLDGGQAGTQ